MSDFYLLKLQKQKNHREVTIKKNYDGEILVGYFLFDIVAIINFRAYCCYNLKSCCVI